MAGPTYRVRIVKPDFELEAEGNKAFVMEMINRFETPTPAPSSSKKTTRTHSTADAQKAILGKKMLSVGEFVRQVGAKKHTETVLAFGYYLEKYGGVKEFTAADINRCYYDSKMESSNTSQMINNNIRTRRMMEAKKKKGEKGRKAYVLTRTGEDLIEKNLKKTEQ